MPRSIADVLIDTALGISRRDLWTSLLQSPGPMLEMGDNLVRSVDSRIGRRRDKGRLTGGTDLVRLSISTFSPS
jgi:hypothetical protein